MHDSLNNLISLAGNILLGKQHQIKQALCCVLAGGHLLIEDIPGVGKTTLSHTFAELLGLDFQRIQFTSDLFPADIIGATIFDAKNHEFKFHPGPIFNQMVLADEINRSTPKTQSALLEAMEEHQVTVDGNTLSLPNPFFVIATQNPNYQIGTFPLPESQLDRFLMSIQLGYPGRQAERSLLKGKDRQSLMKTLPVCLPPQQLEQVQSRVFDVHASEPLLDYLQDIVDYSRHSTNYQLGLSPRAAQALLHAAKSWAFLDNRDAVFPEDIQQILPAVAGHRLRQTQSSTASAEDVVAPILENVFIP